MGVFKQLGEYFYLRKKDPDQPSNREIRFMHWTNKISLLVFIICMIILAVKLIRK